MKQIRIESFRDIDTEGNQINCYHPVVFNMDGKEYIPCRAIQVNNGASPVGRSAKLHIVKDEHPYLFADLASGLVGTGCFLPGKVVNRKIDPIQIKGKSVDVVTISYLLNNEEEDTIAFEKALRLLVREIEQGFGKRLGHLTRRKIF